MNSTVYSCNVCILQAPNFCCKFIYSQLSEKLARGASPDFTWIIFLKNLHYGNVFIKSFLTLCLYSVDDDEDDKFLVQSEEDDIYEYELIGVTVHTGTADGGHYYSFIRDKLHKSESGQDKW